MEVDLHVCRALPRGYHRSEILCKSFAIAIAGQVRPLKEFINRLALPIENVVALAKSRLTRSLTTEECQQYLHVATCPAK